MRKVEQSADAPFPAGIIIIGREHTNERLKKFPVTDLQDLKAVLGHELGGEAITDTPKIGQTNSEVFVWELDQEVKQKLSGSYTVWLPETLLFLPEENSVNVINRAENTLFAFTQGAHRFSSIAKGAMTSPSYFLMTLGLPEKSERAWSEQDYIKRLLNGLWQLEPQRIVGLLKAQKHLFESVKRWPFRSAFAGIFLGWCLVQGFQYLNLKYQLSAVQAQLNSQNIAEVVQAKKEIEEKVALFKQLSNNSSGQNKERQLWDVLGSIMEANLTIIRFRTTAEGVQVRLEAQVATEGLELIQAMPGVASANFAAPVQNSLDKQRFTVDVKFGTKTQEASRAAE